MNIFDLHCDTLYKAVTENVPLDCETMEVKLNKNKRSHKLQCYAIWMPDTLDGDKAEKLLFRSAGLLKSECERLGVKLINRGENPSEIFYENMNSAFFTIENSTAINNKLENIAKFAKLGVKIMTLTWNAKNRIGGGADTNQDNGLTKFGQIAIREMEKHGIVVDISHASEQLFCDVAQTASRPFIATHSNAFSVTPHRRNLKDYQIEAIKNSGGIIGINFHNAFLNSNSEEANITDIVRHITYFLEKDCENCLCFGSDFDGGILPRDFADSSVYNRIYSLLLKNNYKEELLNKIFYLNALNFFENFDN